MPASQRTLAYGAAVIEVGSSDPSAADWLREVLEPWFAPTDRKADWHVTLSHSADGYADLCAGRPLGAAARACFALDQEVLSLPAWPAADGVIVADPERSCCLALAPSRARLVGDPGTRRWRFTSMLLCHEIAATRLRGTCLDVHAAAVEVSGRAVLIVGPKGAGKTTLALHLLRSGLCGMMANDRAFVGCESGAVVVRGVPTAVKVRPSTQAEFPELRRDLPPVERPYLYTLDELAREASSPGRVDSTEFALSPAQLARQLRVTPVGTAPLGAVVFPEVRADLVGWAVERLDAAGAGRRLFANLYGGPPGRRGPTIFEELDGGGRLPSGDLATELARTVPAYRVTLGSGAYAERRFAERLLKTLGPA